MTREQAINYLASSGMTDEQITEIVTAIERTQTHACDCDRKETHGDLISRQDAIDALDKRFDDIPMELTTEIMLLRNDLRERIPSAKPEQVRTQMSSADCISRQAAIDWLTNEWDGMVTSAFAGIKNLPSAEPELVRCKECENWDASWSSDLEPNTHYCPIIDKRCEGNWYCADAERRTDENPDIS